MRTDSNVGTTSSNNTTSGSRFDSIKILAGTCDVISRAASIRKCGVEARNRAWRNVTDGLAIDGGNKGGKSKSELHFVEWKK